MNSETTSLRKGARNSSFCKVNELLIGGGGMLDWIVKLMCKISLGIRKPEQLCPY